MLSEKEKLELEQLKADENVKRALRQQRKKIDPERKKLYQYRWLKRRGENSPCKNNILWEIRIMQDSIKQDENVVRTYAQREQIFAKEYLDVNDFMCLFGIGLPSAYKLMREIKRQTDRLKISGRVHIQDYFEYFDIPETSRYVQPKEVKSDD